MNTSKYFALAALVATAVFSGSTLGKDMPDDWDGLVKVKPKRMDAAYVAPGADFRIYTKVMIDPTEVAFKKDWRRDVNDSSMGISRDVSQEDAEKIATAARTGFDDVFKSAFVEAGVQVVTSPGPDVLRLSPAVMNLYINAPDVMSPGMSRSYTAEAGEATLVLEARDSTTGALLGRVLDRRETQQSGGVQWTTSVSNRSDFERLFKQWSAISVKGLTELKAHSPVPSDLKPNQKL